MEEPLFYINCYHFIEDEDEDGIIYPVCLRGYCIEDGCFAECSYYKRFLNRKSKRRRNNG